jgi:hypothetical protein
MIASTEIRKLMPFVAGTFSSLVLRNISGKCNIGDNPRKKSL